MSERRSWKQAIMMQALASSDSFMCQAVACYHMTERRMDHSIWTSIAIVSIRLILVFENVDNTQLMEIGTQTSRVHMVPSFERRKQVHPCMTMQTFVLEINAR